MDKIIYEKVGERLKLAREKSGKTLEIAGNKVGVHKSTVLRWENGETEKIKVPILDTLAQFYNVNPAWLMGYDVPMERFYLPDAKSPSTAVVHIYGTIPAGIPMECIEDILDTEEIPADMLKGGKQFFGLRVKGDSMFPDYLDGDTLIIEKTEDCESGDDAIVMVNGNDGTFKRIFKNETGIILQPLNPIYAPMVYSNEQILSLPVKVLGVVVELRRKKK